MLKTRLVISDCHDLFAKGLRELIGKTKEFDCVAIAVNQEDTLRLTSELSPDLLLLDICLVEHMITSLLTDIRSSSPETRVIVLTHSIKQDEITESLRAGAVGYLLKDIGEQQLLDSLRAVCSGQQVLSPIITHMITHDINTKQLADDSSSLSERELEVIQLVAMGKSNKEIALELSLSEHTVASHLIHIYRRFNVQTRTEAIVYCLSHNLITVQEEV